MDDGQVKELNSTKLLYLLHVVLVPDTFHWPQTQTYSHVHHNERDISYHSQGERKLHAFEDTSFPGYGAVLINIHHYLRIACCFQLQDTSSPEL